ncbi:hypothetical protein WJX72_011120 [[Myrmecia] bisecta]|uniref:Uncharacterized protein n=1 Tax=[Myrmecia] bisecta TaxID=41462 RepID=A0AAW1P2N8_9CHLO
MASSLDVPERLLRGSVVVRQLNVSVQAEAAGAVEQLLAVFLQEPGNQLVAQYLLAAVASMHIFLQANLTGPRLAVTDSPAQLIQDGGELVGRCRLPQYLLLALTILRAGPGMADASTDAGDGLAELVPSWRWWLVRALTLQQRLLADRAASIRAALQQHVPKVLAHYASSASAGPEDASLAAAAHLEAALAEHLYGHTATAQAHLEAAGQAAGVQIQVTGEMGLRTHHQQDPKAQMVAVSLSAQALVPDEDADESAVLDAASVGAATASGLAGLSMESDVLSVPRLVDNGGQELQRPLSCLEQALLLAWTVQVQKGTSNDELQAWQMAPYIEAVLRQPRSAHLLRASARLHRARHERTRTRTKERALMQIQQIADCMAVEQPPNWRRMRLAYGVWFPLYTELQKELGEQLLANGLVGGAMEVFEKLELWDSLILCYRLLDKKVQAQELVQQRLQVTPDDSRLWCALGDLTLDDAAYETAWERSGHHSTRAQRSLARSAHRRKEYAKSAKHWEKALAINPLFPDGWFALGYCALKTGDYARAVQAYTRCAQEEPDNGEAWNNIAAIHLQQQRHREAFTALMEAVKYKRDSWQTWSNYAQAAAQTGMWQQAARGVQQALATSDGQHVQVDTLKVLVEQVGANRRDAESYGKADATLPHAATQLERGVQDCLKQAVNSSAVSPALWGMYAAFYRATGFPTSAREASLKQVRALQSSGWQSEESKFAAFAEASQALCTTNC